MAMFLEGEEQASETRAKLENDEEFTDLAKELSLDSFSEENEGDLGWRPEGVLTELLTTSVVEEYAFSSDIEVLSQPLYDEDKTKNVGYWIIKVLDRREEPEEAEVQVILLSSEEQAQTVRTRLEAGEDFATLAQELSQHDASKEDGGDVGWITPDMMSSTVDEFVFNTEPELSQPLRDEDVWTIGGYWLVKVIDIDDNKEIEDEDRDLLKAKAFNEWVLALWDNPENEIDDSFLDAERKEWAIWKVLEG
jgi:parvulin-like peptidyl-prolyl isomerase